MLIPGTSGEAARVLMCVACSAFPVTLSSLARMDLDVGSPAWYVAVLVVGLVTGLIIAWIRRETGRDDS